MIRFASVLAVFLASSIGWAADNPPAWRAVKCEGVYPHHLQGVCMDEAESIFWCLTTKLVKTDRDGKVLKLIEVGNHHGDLCFHDGKLFVAVNFGKFNDAAGNADSWVYVYNAADLSLLDKHKTPEVFYGAGGIAYRDGKFMVVGGLPKGVQENYVFEYDRDFKFVKQHRILSGHTLMGIQTAAFADGSWWFGCYGDPKTLLSADKSLKRCERFEFDGSLGIVAVDKGKFLIGRGTYSKEKGHAGRLVLAEPHKDGGLRLVDAQSSDH